LSSTDPARAARAVPTVSIPATRYELTCGATLLVHRRPGAPVAAIDAHVRGGPSLDPEGLEGLAYLTGALADQGTRRHDEERLAELLEPHGGDLQGESTGISGSIVAGEWETLGDLVCELLTEPTYPAAAVRRQRERMLRRLANEEADPRRRGSLAFRRMIYGDHWLGRPAYGSSASVAAVEPRHLRAHHRKNWVASRAVIGFCGDAEPEEVRRFFERRLARWRRGAPLEPRTPRFPSPRAALKVVPARRKQVHVFLGHLGIRRSDPDYARLVVMDHVLGQGPGFTDRISRRLRDELGLAYSVSAGISASAGISPGTFTAYIGTSPEHVVTAVEHFLAELRRIRDELVSEEELRMAKDYLSGSFSMGFERATRRASYLVTTEVHGLPEDSLERLPREFEAVTAEELREAARAYLFPDRCCVTAAGPVDAAALRRALGAAGGRRR
jgi:zinc protease